LGEDMTKLTKQITDFPQIFIFSAKYLGIGRSAFLIF